MKKKTFFVCESIEQQQKLRYTKYRSIALRFKRRSREDGITFAKERFLLTFSREKVSAFCYFPAFKSK